MKTLMFVFESRTAHRRGVPGRVADAAVQRRRYPLSSRHRRPATPRPQYERVVLTAGRSTVLATDFDITRIAITNPAVADAVVVRRARSSSTARRRHGQPDHLGRRHAPPVRPRRRSGHQGPPAAAADAVSGRGHPGHRQRGGDDPVGPRLEQRRDAEGRRDRRPRRRKRKVINLLQVPGGIESQQVMLQVRFAEVNRKALTELGITLFANRDRFAADRTTTSSSPRRPSTTQNPAERCSATS